MAVGPVHSCPFAMRSADLKRVLVITRGATPHWRSRFFLPDMVYTQHSLVVFPV